ncbi:hypothetical protein BGZ97_007102, partial [Linnemannia gamsii]
LVYYTYKKIADLNTWDFFIQSTETFANDNDLSSLMPDILICGNRTTIGRYDRTSATNVELRKRMYDPRRDFNFTGYAPCGSYNSMIILSWMDYKMENLEAYGSVIFNLIATSTSEQLSILIFDFLKLLRIFKDRCGSIPNDYNISSNNGTSPIEVSLPQHTKKNTYYINPINTQISFKLTPKSTRVIRRDFWGLLGEHDIKPLRTLVTIPDYSAFTDTGASIGIINSRTSRLLFYAPTIHIDEIQILITTIPSVISSIGGAFSAVWGVFYVIFGTPRMTPFGLISTCLLRKCTKKKLSYNYCEWRQDLKARLERPDNVYEELHVPAGGGHASCSNWSSASTVSRPGIPQTQVLVSHATGTSTLDESNVKTNQPEENLLLLPQISAPETYASPVEDIIPLRTELNFLREIIGKHEKQLTNQDDEVQQGRAEFKELERFLSEYYLEMDIINTDGPAPFSPSSWFQRAKDIFVVRKIQSRTMLEICNHDTTDTESAHELHPMNIQEHKTRIA